MAGTLELNAGPMTLADMEVCACRARAYQGYRESVAEVFAQRTLKPPVLCELNGYTIRNFPPIQVRAVMAGVPPEFWESAEALVGDTLSFMVYVDVGESGIGFDAETQTDVRLRMGHGFLGTAVALEIGEVSPGASDLAYRQDLFAAFLASLGMQDRLRVQFEDDNLYLDKLDPGMRSSGELSRTELIAFRREGGAVFEWENDGRSGSSRKLGLYCLDLPDLRRASSRILSALGGQDRIVESQLSMGCSSAQYPRVREVLRDAPFTGWQISFSGAWQYNLDQLTQAVAENDSFHFEAFRLESSDAGEVSVECWYAGEQFSLNFMCDYRDDGQRKALMDLAKEIVPEEVPIEECVP